MLEPPHSFKSVTKLHIQANQVLYCLTVSGFTTLEENRRKYNTVEFYVIFYNDNVFFLHNNNNALHLGENSEHHMAA